MKASHIMNILQLMAEEAEQAPRMEEHGQSVAGALFLGEQFARNAHLLSFFGEHRLMGAGACDVNPKWDRLKQALVSYCRSLPEGMAAPMLKFLKSDSSRLLNERPKRGKDQHVVGQVPVVRGVAVNGFKEACENVVQHIAFTGNETGNALSLYRGTTILPEAVSWQDLREVAFAMSEEAAKPKGDMGAPFFFNQTIVSGIYRLCHGKIETADTNQVELETFVKLHDDIQTGLMKLVSGVAEVAGLTIETGKSRRGTHARRETTVVKAGSNSFRIPGPMKFPAGSVEDFPFDDFRKDLELLNALALKAVKHIQSLKDGAVNWDNQCDKFSIEIARKALYEYGFDDYADGNVPMGLTVEQFFRVVETKKPDVAEVHGKVNAEKTNQTPDDEGRFNERPWGLEDRHQYGTVTVVRAGRELKWKTGRAAEEYGLPEEMTFTFATPSMWRVFAKVLLANGGEVGLGSEMGDVAAWRDGHPNSNEGWLFRMLAFVQRNRGRAGWTYRLRTIDDEAVHLSGKEKKKLQDEIAAYKKKRHLA